MMKMFTVYDPASGRIVRTGATHITAFEAEAEEGFAVAEGFADDTLHYVLDGQIVDRPQFPVAREASVPADGETTFTLAELPEGTEVQIDDGAPIVLPDTTLELTFDAPGTYTLYLRRFPYIDAQVTIHAY